MDDPSLPADIDGSLDELQFAAESADYGASEAPPAPADHSEVIQEDDQEDAIPVEDLLGVFTSRVFEIVAARRGDHWLLTEKEALVLGKAYADVVKAWLPEESIGPTMSAVMISAIVFGPRIARDRQLEALADEKEEAELDEAA